MNSDSATVPVAVVVLSAPVSALGAAQNEAIVGSGEGRGQWPVEDQEAVL